MQMVADLDAETQIEFERMAMNKRIAEFKLTQERELRGIAPPTVQPFTQCM